MLTKLLNISIALILLVATPALADWDEGEPYKMHFPQLPDLTTTGMDVLDGPINTLPGTGEYYEKFLADDWLCTESGAVTDIHFWGSHNEDLHLTDTPQFSLVIYDNIPASDSSTGYSMPGLPLWDAYMTPTAERIYANTPGEAFYDPNLGPDGIIGFDTEVWQYNFEFTEAEAFWQEEGKIYWLGVKHSFDLNADGTVDLIDLSFLVSQWPAAYGWKTADVDRYPDPYTGQHYEDDAVWIDVDTMGSNGHVVPEPSMWNELYDPFTGDSLDLSFVITPEPATLGVLLLGGLALFRRRRGWAVCQPRVDHPPWL